MNCQNEEPNKTSRIKRSLPKDFKRKKIREKQEDIFLVETPPCRNPEYGHLSLWQRDDAQSHEMACLFLDSSRRHLLLIGKKISFSSPGELGQMDTAWISIRVRVHTGSTWFSDTDALGLPNGTVMVDE